MRSLKKLLYRLVSEKKIDPKDAMLIFKEIEANDKYLDDDIAVIGMAARLPMADTIEEFWQNLKENKDCISGIPAQRKNDLETFFQGEKKKNIEFRPSGYLKHIDHFDASFFRISPKEADYMEPEQRLLIEVVWEAIEDAGCALRIKNSMTGVFIGHDHIAGFPYRNYTGGLNNPDTLALTGTYPSILSSRISYIFNLKGPNLVIDTACSSGLVAVHEACLALRNKKCDIAIAGGISLQLWPVKYKSFKMVETDRKIVRTFDKNSAGTVWGEGICAFLLKPYSLALKDRDNIHAIIKGIAINNDGVSSGITAPNAEAQEDVILKAWQEAGIDPQTISYIETHGTGTVMGDPIEVKALQNAFSRFTDKKQYCGIGSLKPNIGHLISASGTASLIKVIYSMKKKELPATINFLEPNSYIDFCNSPLYVNDRLSKWETDGCPRRAGISCFGFSGTNCHLLLEEAPILETLPVDKFQHVFTLSAKSIDILMTIVNNYIDFLWKNPGISIEDICYTVNTGRYHFECRLALLFSKREELLKKLEAIKHDGFYKSNSADIFCGIHEIVVQNITKNSENNDPAFSAGGAVITRITERDKEKLSNEACIKFEELLKKDQKKAYESLCGFYIQGADIAWTDFLYQENPGRKISLPVYPFKRERHWYFPGHISEKSHENNHFFKTSWIPQKLMEKSVLDFKGKILIFIDEWGLGTSIAQIIRTKNTDVFEIQMKKSDNDLFDTKIKNINENVYMIDGSYESYDLLLKEIDAGKLSAIIHLQTLLKNSEITEIADFDELVKRGVKSLFFLARALISNKCKQNIDLILVSDYVNEVTKDVGKINPLNNTLFGLAKVVGQEYRNLKCTCIDIDKDMNGEKILAEFGEPYRRRVVAYRKGIRYVEELKRIGIAAIPEKITKIKNNGVYLITGGTGGIGLEIAKYLASKGKVNLCLVNRRNLPERKRWAGILKTGTDDNVKRIIKSIKEIEKKDSRVAFYSADISINQEIKAVLESIREEFGEINGIIHSAGIAGNGFLIKKDGKEFDNVLSPKILGTWNLDTLTKKDKLDFFILFSSIIAVMGSAGQGDYAAANSFLESYAFFRKKQGKRTLVISWAPWKETGMAFNSGYNETAAPFKPLLTTTAMDAFHKVLHKDLIHVIIGEPDYKILNSIKDYIHIKLSEDLQKKINELGNISELKQSVKHTAVHVLLKGRKNGVYTSLEKELAAMWHEVLGIKEIDVYDSFMKLGGDSIIATNLLTKLENKFGDFIDISDIFTYSTIDQMAKYIDTMSLKKKKAVLTNEEIMNKLANGEITIKEASELRDQLKVKLR